MLQVKQKVRVVRDTETSEGVKRDTIKDGYVVQLTNSHARVYTPKKRGSEEGDPPHLDHFYEWYAINGKIIKVFAA